MYGLNTHFIENILNQYFGNTKPNKTKKNIYVGLGLALQGATQNLYDFDEVSVDVENTLNYKRCRVSFSEAFDGVMTNNNTIIFPTANEDWTTDTRKIQSVGIFDTDKFNEGENLIKPLVILQLPCLIEIKAGETAMFDPSTIVLNLSDE
jgi:hypothetical protein